MRSHKWLAKLVDPRFDWRLLQNFSDIAEFRSFRGASVERRSAFNTVRTRLAEFERVTGRKLVERDQQGITLTDDGEMVLTVVLAMIETRDMVVADLGG